MTTRPRPAIFVYQRSVVPYRRPFFALSAGLLAAEGFDLIVASAEEPATAEPGAMGEGPRYLRLGSLLHRTIKRASITEDLVIPRGLGRALHRVDPVVVVTEDLSALPGNLVIPVWAALRRRPYLIWTLGPSIPGKAPMRLRRLLAPAFAAIRRPAAGFICYSSWSAARLEETYGKPCYVAPNSTVAKPGPIDLSALPRIGAGPLRIVFIGRIAPQKRLDRLLRAMAQARIASELDVIGASAEPGKMEALAEELGLTRRVRFHGEVRDEARKAELIDQAHVGVMPGLGGLFLQEVQARGCPAIAGPADGTEQDLVRAVNPELYLDQPTALSIAGRLEWIADDEARLSGARQRALDVIREQYNLDCMARNWVAGVLATVRGKPAR